jgi:uncharacterized NAD-dependent epimerase/dehydratase family protein
MLSEEEAMAVKKRISEESGVPAYDPVRDGVHGFIERLS